MASKVVKQKKSSALLLHPPYITMISEAICYLNERSGSSHPAIAKYLEVKYKAHLRPNFRKMLSVQLKRFSKSKKLVKVKNSYKLSVPAPKKTAMKKMAKEAKSLVRKVVKGKKAKKEGAKDEKKKVVVKKAKSAKATPKKTAKSLKVVKTTQMKKRTVKSVKSPSKKKAAAAKKAKN